jgi:hypothetical protein
MLGVQCHQTIVLRTTAQVDVHQSTWGTLGEESRWQAYAEGATRAAHRIQFFEPHVVVAVDWHGVLAWKSLQNHDTSLANVKWVFSMYRVYCRTSESQVRTTPSVMLPFWHLLSGGNLLQAMTNASPAAHLYNPKSVRNKHFPKVPSRSVPCCGCSAFVSNSAPIWRILACS